MEPQERKLRTNLDTDLLKLVAIAAMLLDHIGGAFFPETPIFRWIGRLAFPLFCYCLTVGLLYTHDIRRYLGRLAIFAVVSQPFWILAFNADVTAVLFSPRVSNVVGNRIVKQMDILRHQSNLVT